MISTLVTPSAENSFSFPLLLQSKTVPNFIILFTNEDCGTVVAIPSGYDADFGLGLHQEDWDINKFELFKGSVDLCNEADSDEESESSDEDEQGFQFATCAMDPVSLVTLLEQLGKRAANTCQDNPPEATEGPTPGTPTADGDCGYDNAFLAFLERMHATGKEVQSASKNG